MNSITRIEDNTFFSQSGALTKDFNISGRPDWSPDSKFIIFSADNKIWKRGVEDNTFSVLNDDGINRANPKWSPDGSKIVCDGDGIWTMRPNGDNLNQLAPAGLAPEWSPDSTKIIYQNPAFINSTAAQAISIILDLSESKTNYYNISGNFVANLPQNFYWTPDSKLILHTFVSPVYGSLILKANLDINSPTYGSYDLLTSQGDGVNSPITINGNITSDGLKMCYFSLVSNYVDNNWKMKSSINLMDLDGENKNQLTSGVYYDRDPQISPDGTKIAFISDRNGTEDIWMMNLDGTELQSITKIQNNASTPRWSPDGSKLLFLVDGDLHILK